METYDVNVIDRAVEGNMHLFIRHAVANILQVSADIVHVGVAKENPSKVFLTDGGHALRVGEELYLKQFCLQVIHEPGGVRRTGDAERKRHYQELSSKKGLRHSHKEKLLDVQLKMINGEDYTVR